MYLEISNVAAALGKNPYESKEKMLLVSWARHCPKIVFDYLIYNNCIIEIKQDINRKLIKSISRILIVVFVGFI